MVSKMQKKKSKTKKQYTSLQGPLLDYHKARSIKY